MSKERKIYSHRDALILRMNFIAIDVEQTITQPYPLPSSTILDNHFDYDYSLFFFSYRKINFIILEIEFCFFF